MNIRNATIAALTLSCAMTFSVPAAHSSTLLDFLKGKTSSHERRESSGGGIFSGSLDDGLGDFPDAARPAKELPKVSAPKYFTYKADSLRYIAVAKFAPAMET